MYWSKIATTQEEFDAISTLNYETFVEEIPQHAPNETRRLLDKFHDENVYLVVYKNTGIVGMIAFRDVRPFSIDQKLGSVEQYLDAALCESLCELRLLAVKKEHRNGRVFAKLAWLLYRLSAFRFRYFKELSEKITGRYEGRIFRHKGCICAYSSNKAVPEC